MQTVEFKTTWGTISLTRNREGEIVALDLPSLENEPRNAFAVLGKIPAGAEFFKTLKKKFPNIGTPKGTAFQMAVWGKLKKIPQGQTLTYGEIAAAIGHPKAVRAVGSACGANPLPVFIPCHRVVAANGLGGFGSGLPWKILLLKMEGAL